MYVCMYLHNANARSQRAGSDCGVLVRPPSVPAAAQPSLIHAPAAGDHGDRPRSSKPQFVTERTKSKDAIATN
jgi:hypothetical protein